MKRYSAYLRALLRHKWYVFLEGRKLGLGIPRLLIHDWDKFGYKMFLAYARTFYTAEGKGQYEPDPDFDPTWNRHQKINRHHWQFWLLTRDTGELVPLKMPELDLLEMIADWRGAGRAYAKPGQKWKLSETVEWYEKNREKMILHAETRSRVEVILAYRYRIPSDNSGIDLPNLKGH